MLYLYKNINKEVLLKEAARTHLGHPVCSGIIMNLSSLNVSLESRNHGLILNFIKNEFAHYDVYAYLMEPFDMVFFLPDLDSSVVQKLYDRMMYFLSDIYKLSDEDKTYHLNLFDFSNQYEVFCTHVNKIGEASQENESIDFNELFQKNYKPKNFKSLLDSRQNRLDRIILIVEDQFFSQNILRAAIGNGYVIQTAEDALTALLIYLQVAPDICFLDWHLPEVNGIKLLEIIKKIDPRSFVVMSTADRNSSNVKTALNKGVDGYVTKPFNKVKIQKYLKLYEEKISA